MTPTTIDELLQVWEERVKDLKKEGRARKSSGDTGFFIGRSMELLIALKELQSLNEKLKANATQKS